MLWQVSVLILLSAASASSVCEDPPCTPDVLLFGAFNGSVANSSTRVWNTTHADGSRISASNFSSRPARFAGVVGSAGFAMATTGTLMFPTTWGCRGLIVTARSVSSGYSGYTVSFGSGDLASASNSTVYSSPGYKAHCNLTENFQDVYISLLDFSRSWPAPGTPPSPDCHHDTSVCPTFLQMQNLEVLAVWAEGSSGDFGIEIDSIRASSCYQPSSRSGHGL